jgi:hypothetical protein
VASMRDRASEGSASADAYCAFPDPQTQFGPQAFTLLQPCLTTRQIFMF